MPSKFRIVAKAKLRKKIAAERAAKKAKRPRFPWKWSVQDPSFKANVGDVVSEKFTFKDYLIIEAKYYRQQEKEDWQDDVDDAGVGIGVCPKCGSEARFISDWNPHGGMGSYWACQNSECTYEEER